MPRYSFLSLMIATTLAAACSGGASTSSDQSASPGTWGSSDASLTIANGSATLQILASGGCFGSYGDIDLPIPTGQFNRPGTYTQLTGAAPGKTQYEAQFSGTVDAGRMSISVGVPALGASLGPFLLSYGVDSSWVACRYP